MKKVLYALLALIAIVVITMFVTGKDYHYEQSIVINAPAEKVYAHISSTKAFNEWNPWLKFDPNMKMEYSGTPGQVGDKYCWEGNEDAGAGCQEIIELVPNQRQKTRIQFIKPFESIATSDVILTPEGNQTKVTWTMDTEMNYPMNLMKFFMDGNMDKSYGEGLKKLKEIAEKP